MKKMILLSIFVAYLFPSAYSQFTRSLNINNFSSEFSPDNILFNDGSPASNFPAQDQTSTIFSGAIWVTAQRNSDSLVAAARYNSNGRDFDAGPVRNSGLGAYRDFIHAVTQSEVTQHLNQVGAVGYTPPSAIMDWPANNSSADGELIGQAPFVDVNGNGYYDPITGDYPLVRGDKAVYYVLNDSTIDEKRETQSGKLGIEMHVYLYAYSSLTDPFLDNSIFANVSVINRSADTLKNMKIGNYMDWDIGCSEDDYIGSDSARNLAYAYNGDNEDIACNGTSGFDNNLVATGTVFLSEAAEGFMYFDRTVAFPRTDPSTAVQYINYMNSVWQDGTPLTSGGTGYNVNGGNSTKYMFSGVPISGTGWTEAQNQPGDRRGVAYSSGMDVAPGERRCVDLAFLNAQDTGSNLNSVQKLFTYTDQLATWYAQNQITACLPIATATAPPLSVINVSGDEISIFPNPGNGSINVAARSEIESIHVFDLSGRLMHQLEDASTAPVKLEVEAQSSQLLLISVKTKSGTSMHRYQVQ